MMIVETGAGLSNADSYCSLAESKTILSQINDPDWSGNDAILESHLIQATQFIDTLYGSKFISSKKGSTQSLKFPRVPYLDIEGFMESGIPIELRKATAVLGSRLKTGALVGLPTEAMSQYVKRETVKVDVLEETREFFQAPKVQYEGWNEIEAYLAPLMKAKKSSIQLVR